MQDPINLLIICSENQEVRQETEIIQEVEVHQETEIIQEAEVRQETEV
jgi:hypothetical protein